MGIGQNLRKLRTEQKKSQQEIADLLDVDRRTYIGWENETTDIKSQFIPKLAMLFGVEIKDLFEEPSSKIEIIQNHNEGKDNSFMNGAILIITDQKSVESLVEVVKDKMKKM